jgi:hypothetical protein
VLRLYDRCNQQTAIQFLDYLLERLPFRVEVIQTDNGAEFGSSFHWHVLDKGIGHVYIKPRTPRLNGKVERSHRIDAEEFYQLLDGVVIDDTEVFNDKLREWENFYNYHRPHGGLGGQTPYERLKQRTQTRGTPEPPGIPGRFSLAWPPPPRPVALHPTYASWLNPVEVFFSMVERQALGRGDFASVGDLVAAIGRFISAWNQRCQPFVWTKDADTIGGKLNRTRTAATVRSASASLPP